MSSFPGVLEQSLLLQCAYPVATPHKRLQPDPASLSALNWQLVLKQARAHSILPLLHRFLSQNPEWDPPADVVGFLSSHVLEQSVTNLFQLRELIRMLDVLNEAGVHAIPFKGPTLSAYLYNDTGIRPFSDLDLLIDREAFPRLKEVMMAQGYRPFRTFTPAQEETFLETQMGYEFVRHDERVVFEVHWSFLNKVHAFRLDPAAVRERSQNVTVAGKNVPMFEPADLLLYLCAHGSKSFWERLRWICDIAELVVRHREDDTIETARKRARAIQSERMLLIGLNLAQHLLDVELPGDLKQELRWDGTVGQLTNAVVQQLFTGTNLPPKYQLNFHLQMRERFRDRLPYYRHIVQLYLYGNEKDRALISLPPALSFLYPVVKPFRLIRDKLGFAPAYSGDDSVRQEF
ncbi:MAG: nucleotidyltransferase family protein [Rhodothermales bacterium]